jgi:hypothetical protein
MARVRIPLGHRCGRFGMLPQMRAGVVLIAFLLAAPAAADAAAPYWSIGKALRRVDGAAIRVGTRTVRIESESTLCSGYGTSIRHRRLRMWRHFDCTYTTFTKAGVDRDLEFRLHVRSATRFRFSDAHWISGVIGSSGAFPPASGG